MNFGKWLGIGGIKDFPYDLGEELEVQPRTHWVQRKGSKHSDGSEVTVFQYEKKASDPDETSLATNGWKKTKMLMLPGFLKCFDAVETPTHLYIATEPCMPLIDVLENTDEFTEEEKREEFIAYGVYSIIQALTHLHERQLMHGNCSKHAVYCTKSGDWRLWGLDWVTNLNDPDSSSHFKSFSRHLPQEYLSPELAKQNWQVIEKSPAHAVDSWSLACLIYEVFNGALDGPADPSAMKSRKQIPVDLFSSYTGLLNTAPRGRTNPSKLLSSCDYFTDSTYINVQKEIDEISLKDQVERDLFFRKLAQVVDSFPCANCKYTVLPKLTTALTYGSGGASALEPMLLIGKKLTDAEYTELVVPGVLQLFSSPEPIVRIKLLQNVSSFAKAIPQNLLCAQIWPLLSQGFVNKVPEIRELTIKAMVSVVPHLSPALIDEACKQLIRLQSDVEGGIRTNATICLGMVAQHIPASERAITLHKAFARMLKDKFIHSRTAAIGSYMACIDHFDANVLAQGVLPALTPSLIDSEKDVRQKALKAVKACLAKVEAAQDGMPVAAPAAAGTPQGTPTRESSSEGGAWGWASNAIGGLGSTQKEGSPSGVAASRPVASPASAVTPPRQAEARTATPPAAAEPVSSGGWDDMDDMDDDDGWGSSNSPQQPVSKTSSFASNTAPKAKVSPPLSNLDSSGPSPVSSGSRISGMKLAPKPKKKGLGLKKMD